MGSFLIVCISFSTKFWCGWPCYYISTTNLVTAPINSNYLCKKKTCECFLSKKSSAIYTVMDVYDLLTSAVYQTFIGAMNDKIKRQIATSNPFVFKHISNLKVWLVVVSFCSHMIITWLFWLHPPSPCPEHRSIWWHWSVCDHGQSWYDAEWAVEAAVWSLVHRQEKLSCHRRLLCWRHTS